MYQDKIHTANIHVGNFKTYHPVIHKAHGKYRKLLARSANNLIIRQTNLPNQMKAFNTKDHEENNNSKFYSIRNYLTTYIATENNSSIPMLNNRYFHSI